MANPTMTELAQLFREAAPFAVLTGAGISTDSGIPDYRGEGSPVRTPMNIHEFLNDPRYRQRFWAGASVHQARDSHVLPNRGHFALVTLERAGYTEGVITQNVDGLHEQAGSARVVELHGGGNRVRCVNCGNRFSRHEVIEWFTKANPGYVEAQVDAGAAPDQDAVVTDFETVTVPVCPICTGILRPEVVYFGETVPQDVFAEAANLMERAGGLLVVGSSLAVNTGIRLVHRAAAAGKPIAVINRGPSQADSRATLRFEAGASETLTELCDALGLPVP